MHKVNLKNNPVCAFISSSMIIIFSLYFTDAIKSIPCEKNMPSILISNFIHTDFFHLMSNLYGLYSISLVEHKYGPKKFVFLILFLLIFSTIFEIILHKIIKTPCSIGFSGILYGIFTFETITDKKNIDYNLFLSIIFNIISSKIFQKKISLTGHIIGAITGILGAIIYKKIYF